MARQYHLGNIKGPRGDIGPQGPQGIKGDQGIQGIKGDKGDTGATGTKGADGVTYDWLTGTIAPSSALGKQGDMYIDTTTQDVYKKTNSSTWTIQCNIKGATGATGAKGDKGDQGIQGVKGDKGDTGANGAKGDTGSNGVTYEWLTGSTTPSSALGKQGDMYINTATQDVYKKTGSSAWTIQCNIKGSTGAKGDQGIQGIQGVKGDQGIQGPKGDTGNTGATGAKGDQGVKGDTGATGANGVTYDWLTGTSIPSSALGKQGDMYINTATQDVYKKTSSTVWTKQCSIKGATGSTGAKGDTGDRGPIGGGSGATITIAPYNAMPKSKETADIVLNGDSTDSTKINDAISQLSIGGEIRFLEGTIKCYATINLGSNITISGLGNSTIFQKQFNGVLFSASNKEYVEIRNCKIDANSFGNYSISFSQANDICVEKVLILNAENGIITNSSSSILFSKIKFITNDFCIRISDSNNIKIEKCHCLSLSSSAIFSDSTACNRIFINESTLLGNCFEPVYWRRVHYGGIQNCYIENIAGNTSGSMLQCTYNIISNNILKAEDNEFLLTSGSYNLCIGNIGEFYNMDNSTTIVINNL